MILITDHGHSHGHGHDHKHEKKEKKHDKSEKSHHHHHSHDHNMEGIFLHVLADTLGSVGVMISSVFVHYLGWNIADPICSLCISLLIIGYVFLT